MWDGTTWTLADSGGPLPQIEQDVIMAYDSSRAVSVLFAGYDPHSPHGQTAEWDGETWNRAPASGPSTRGGAAMAYDSARGVTILFGGSGGANYPLSSETWEWDGHVWNLRADTGPTPRVRHAMAFDVARGLTVLFGGRDAAGRNGETWAWNGVSWTRLGTTGPSPRSDHLMSYDIARDRVVLLGGDTSASRLETWEWDGETWELRTSDSPSQRAENGMVYDTSRAATILFGGSPSGTASGIWSWNGVSWFFAEILTTTSTFASALAYDSDRRTFVAFGFDLWELSTRSPDCNLNGIPDSCEPNPPCALITAAASWRNHGGGIGRRKLDIHPGGRLTTEPRIGGISELRLTLRSPPTTTGAQPVLIESRTCPDDGDYVPYTGKAIPSATMAGDELVITFSPSLENAATYRIRPGPEISAVPDQFIEVRALVGDVNGDGRVNAHDRSAVVAAWTSPGFSPQTDFTLDGRTNAADRAVAISAWTGPENCAP